MSSFQGFPSGKVHFTHIPDLFFNQLLPQIDHLGELKVTLYMFWRLERMEGTSRYLSKNDFLDDALFINGLGVNPNEAEMTLNESLERAISRGTLLRAKIPQGEQKTCIYFLNSPKGRAAIRAIELGEWRPGPDPRVPVELDLERPNIYRLYEEHIGPLTPMIAEMLRDAEESYPAQWIEEAIRIAVENNVRKWRYVEAILNRWQEEGRYERKDKRDTEKDRRSYVEGDFAEFIEH